MDILNADGVSVRVCMTREELSNVLAERFVEIAGDAVTKGGSFTVALSGGSTPKTLYSLLAQKQFCNRIAWSKTHLFWGDERCVPHESPESNYKMVRECLLSKIQIPEANVHPTVNQDSDPERAATNYEARLRQVFQTTGESVPCFDLILLGLGPDGHTASLFPGTEAIKETVRLVVANFVTKISSYRITFTFPLLNAARHVIFMVAGEDKKDILPQVLQAQPVIYPAQLIHPHQGILEWYVDQPAAKNLGPLTKT